MNKSPSTDEGVVSATGYPTVDYRAERKTLTSRSRQVHKWPCLSSTLRLNTRRLNEKFKNRHHSNICNFRLRVSDLVSSARSEYHNALGAAV